MTGVGAKQDEEGMATSLEQSVRNPVGPSISLVADIVSPRPFLQMIWVHTATIMAAMAYNLISGQGQTVSDAEYKAVRAILPFKHSNLTRLLGRRHHTPILVRLCIAQNPLHVGSGFEKMVCENLDIMTFYI